MRDCVYILALAEIVSITKRLGNKTAAFLDSKESRSSHMHKVKFKSEVPNLYVKEFVEISSSMKHSEDAKLAISVICPNFFLHKAYGCLEEKDI